MQNPRTDSKRLLQVAAGRALASSGRGREIREAARLSQADLARALGVCHTTVLRIERGEVRPQPETARRYAALLEAISEQVGV